MKTSEVMRLANISRDTLRFYERKNLIKPARRLANGYRDYDPHILDVIRFIRLAQSVGFKLQQIEQAVAYIANPRPGCPRLRDALVEQLLSVRTRIRELKNAQRRIEKWLHANAEAHAQGRG